MCSDAWQIKQNFDKLKTSTVNFIIQFIWFWIGNHERCLYTTETDSALKDQYRLTYLIWALSTGIHYEQESMNGRHPCTFRSFDRRKIERTQTHNVLYVQPWYKSIFFIYLYHPFFLGKMKESTLWKVDFSLRLPRTYLEYLRLCWVSTETRSVLCRNSNLFIG